MPVFPHPYAQINNRPFYYKDAPPSAGKRHGIPRLTRSSTHYQVVDKINRILAGDTEEPLNYSLQVPIDDFSLNYPPNKRLLILDPAGVLNTGLIVLPIDAIDRDKITVTSSQTITALTVQAASGQTLKNAPTSLTGGASFSYVYSASNLTWYRLT